MERSASLLLTDSRLVGENVLSSYVARLSATERARYEGFVRPARQRQFLLGRMLARRAVAGLLGVAEHAVVIEAASGQAPRVSAPCLVAGLSIAHSGPWIACAVSADLALGVDIEQIDAGRDLAALAEHAFDAEQNAWLAARPDDLRVRDFYQLWSRQEAQIKLGAPLGFCLPVPHAELSVVLCAGAEFRLAGGAIQLVTDL